MTRLPGKILVVDDESQNVEVLRRLMTRLGYDVLILDEAADIGFDCVLMDVQMPEMDGLECTAIIREREQVARGHLPIVAMTAHAMEGDAARCLAAGMFAYLSKPIQPDELFDVIERYLGISASLFLARRCHCPGVEPRRPVICVAELPGQIQAAAPRLSGRGLEPRTCMTNQGRVGDDTTTIGLELRCAVTPV